jgi:sulfur carrier protein ThiS
VGYLNLNNVDNGATVSLAEGATVSDLLTHLGVRTSHQRHITPFVNGEKCRLPRVLKGGDDVNLVIQIGGG